MLMEEPQKETSTTVEFKKKNSFLDEEIDSKFLKSWKSISTDDDTMDFNFDTISKSNNKAFNFGKMDVDFNLDGDFEKLSSFTVDLPDLDFSCLPKKSTKPKNSCQEESSKENCPKKKDGLNFSFDFNDLDGFNIDKSIMEGGSASNFKLDRKAVTSSESEGGGSTLDLAEGFETSDDGITKNVHASKILASSKVGISMEGDVVLDSKDAKSKKHMGRSSAPEANTEEQEYENKISSKKEMYMPTSQHANDISVQSKGKNESDQDTCPVLRANICSLEVQEAIASGGEGNINDRTLDTLESYCENVPPNNLFMEHQSGSERNGSEGNNPNGDTSMEIINDIRSMEVDLDHEEKSDSGVNMKMLDSIKDIKQIKNLTPNRPSLPPGGINNEGFTSVSEINGCTLAGESLLCKNGGANRAPTLARIEKKSSEGLSGLCSKTSSCSPTEKTNSKACLITKLLKSPVESHQRSEDVFAQENRLCSIKSIVKMPDLSRLKLRASGGDKVQLNYESQKELNLGNSSKNNKVEQRTTTLKVTHAAEKSDRQKSLLPTLKRKIFEASTADLVPLKPPKRLSPSLNESRNLKESSQEKVRKKINNAPRDDLADRDDCHYEGNVMEIDVHLIMENDGNVEKAESYTKDLENICNMLKKKHEEAKEVLVRALVANNNLLMLNHPIHGEKKIERERKRKKRKRSQHRGSCSAHLQSR